MTDVNVAGIVVGAVAGAWKAAGCTAAADIVASAAAADIAAAADSVASAAAADFVVSAAVQVGIGWTVGTAAAAAAVAAAASCSARAAAASVPISRRAGFLSPGQGVADPTSPHRWHASDCCLRSGGHAHH